MPAAEPADETHILLQIPHRWSFWCCLCNNCNYCRTIWTEIQSLNYIPCNDFLSSSRSAYKSYPELLFKTDNEYLAKFRNVLILFTLILYQLIAPYISNTCHKLNFQTQALLLYIGNHRLSSHSIGCCADTESKSNHVEHSSQEPTLEHSGWGIKIKLILIRGGGKEK